MDHRQLVLDKYPTAFAEDDGESVKIWTKRKATGRCGHCGQSMPTEVTDYQFGCLGVGGTVEAAWKHAAERVDF